MTRGPAGAPAPIPYWAAIPMVVVMLSLAASFGRNSFGRVPARDDIGALRAEYYDTATARKVRKEMIFDGAPCDSCHDGKEAMQGNPMEKGIFHERIELAHGRNQHCFNCHHRVMPADFSNFDGAPIKIDAVELLCARCHGTHYRDWERGSHGRRTGSWDASQGGVRTTACIGCHDPHSPVFKSITAVPAPHVNPRASAGKPRRRDPAEGGGH